MTQDIKDVLKLALEALELAHPRFGIATEKHKQAITAIKEALRENAMREVQRLGQEIEQEPLEYWNAVEGWVKIDEVREHFDSVGCATIYKTAGEGRVPLSLAKAQPEQAPVAVARVDNLERGGRVRALAMGLSLDAPLYTSPPAQRTWVGLTVDELIDLEHKHLSHENLTRAIKAKLKEKNT